MLRKSGILLLTMLYTVTVLGFGLNLHYCGNKVASVNITAATKAMPGKSCGMKMKCCKDQHVSVKVKDIHQAQQKDTVSFKSFSFDLPVIHFTDFIFAAQKALIAKFFQRGPPDESFTGKIAIFLKNCIFRI